MTGDDRGDDLGELRGDDLGEDRLPNDDDDGFLKRSRTRLDAVLFALTSDVCCSMSNGCLLLELCAEARETLSSNRW